MSKKNALGKGLSALLEDVSTDITSPNNRDALGNSQQVGTVSNIEIIKIEPNPFQPRTEFQEEALSELADSIKIHGIIQPITVRKLGYDKYQLISGERRFRASQLAKITVIPAYIRVANDQEMVEMALIENVQREDLNSMEVAISYLRLIEECNLTQEELAERMGKSRSTVTNYIRLLKLPPEIQMGLRNSEMSMGQARALINVDVPEVQLDIYFEIISKGLSVRQVEELVRQYSGDYRTKKSSINKKSIPLEYIEVQKNLSDKFDSKVKLVLTSGEKGSINIPFHSTKDLNRLLDVLEVS